MPKKILIIEDELEICKMVTEFLIDAGYSASYAVNAEAGLAAIEKSLPSLVILDIGLPGVDGIETLRMIQERYPRLPVVILTGQRDPETVKKVLRYGASEYLTKPIHLETLLDHFVKDIIGSPHEPDSKNACGGTD